MTSPEQLVLAAILTCIAGALLTAIISRAGKNLTGWLSFVCTLVSAGFIGSAIGKVLLHGPTLHPPAFWVMPRFGFALRIYVDGLTSIFLLLSILIAVPASLYAIRYMNHYSDYGVARFYPYFLLFLAAMYGLLSTTDMMWFFFIFWQLMTLPGYALIRYEYRKRENVRAANKYLLMMQIACAATMIGAELIAVTGRAVSGAENLKYDFDTVSSNLPLLLSTHPAITTLAFTLFLIGFGIKMGMWPFGQVWLPDAHPAAPSPVSAMLSGVMIKTGVYGLMRYFLWLVPVEAQSHYPMRRWGLAITILGTITLFTGTVQALKQEQSKRLLAFHSIGQVGYILLGFGICMALLSVAGPAAALATIGFMGALLHVLNHGIFKGLLFLNAGSMLWATDTQDLNKMGGLMKYMPLTAITALIASFSISGVPLFNGFVSKWSIYFAAIRGTEYVPDLPAYALIAILTSAITLASFVKFFGVSFLSRSSSQVLERAAHQRMEVGWSMQVPQVFLASLCVLIGILPALAFKLLYAAIAHSQQGLGAVLASTTPAGSRLLLGINFESTAVFAPVAVLVSIAVMSGIAIWVAHLGGASRRAAEPWLCGYAQQQDCYRYTAHHFYGELKRYLWWLSGTPRRQPHKIEIAGRK